MTQQPTGASRLYPELVELKVENLVWIAYDQGRLDGLHKRNSPEKVKELTTSILELLKEAV